MKPFAFLLMPLNLHSLVDDIIREEVLLFGGIDGNFNRFDDFWAWDGENWAEISQ